MYGRVYRSLLMVNLPTKQQAILLELGVKSIYIVPSGTAGSVVFKDGGSGGTTRITINTVASATQPTYMLMPGQGVLFETNVYADVTNIGSVTIFYG
jgi:hypothetical protein